MEQKVSVEEWLAEAKAGAEAAGCGMYLLHNGVVRRSAKKTAREGIPLPQVRAMDFSYDAKKAEAAIAAAREKQGICYVRVWLNSGRLSVGDDIMYVLIGGDIRPRVAEALFALVDELKTHCVTETELSE